MGLDFPTPKLTTRSAFYVERREERAVTRPLFLKVPDDTDTGLPINDM